MKQRDTAIDIAKAIGIILMIIGHYPNIHYLLRNFIYSFHMPLFFILSGYFYKTENIKNVIKSGSIRLIRPYLITSLGVILLCLTINNYDLVKNKIVGIVISNGGNPSEMFSPYLPFIGPIWFLLALFWCKVYYNYLYSKTNKCLIVSLIISTLGFIIGKYIINLPFGILTGICGMVFYAMGDYWKHTIKTPIKKLYLIIGILIWLFCIWNSHLEIATFECKHYPISMFSAFIGTYVIYLAAQRIPSFLKPILSWIGQNTLLILCYHTLATYIIMNIKHYLLTPYAFDISTLNEWILCFFFSLALPFIHISIKKRFLSRLTLKTQ